MFYSDKHRLAEAVNERLLGCLLKDGEHTIRNTVLPRVPAPSPD